MIRNISLIVLFLHASCMTKSYVNYLIDPAIKVNKDIQDLDEPRLKPALIGSDQIMRVNWNDGETFTHIEIPLLTSGQRIIIDHSKSINKSKNIHSVDTPMITPPPPSRNDVVHNTLALAYKEKGFKENLKASPVSLSKSREKLSNALKQGNYVLAQEYIVHVLRRYPSHPEFLRAKGSVLLLMGEKDKAIEVYEDAQEIEYDPGVERKLKTLNK